MKKVLMIHRFQEDFFDLPLEDYILTFDDGYRSPLYYWDELKKINTTKIFFIAPQLLSTGFEYQCKELFLDVSDLMYLKNDAIIGAHSYSHLRIAEIRRLSIKVKLIREDTEKMMKWFRNELGIVPDRFCFPYNRYCPIYKGMLEKNYGFKHFYGSERVDIETLIGEENEQKS